MPFGSDSGHSSYSYLVTIAVVVLVVVLRNSRPRKLQVDRLWVYPLILVILLGSSLAAAPPPVTITSVSLMVGGFVIGALVGWQRGRFTRIELDPVTHAMTSRSSPIGIVLILAVFGLRYGLRDLLATYPQLVGVPVLAAGDALIALTVGMLGATRLEIWIRATRMLQEAKTGGPDATPPLVS
jgi:hypothetical protein